MAEVKNCGAPEREGVKNCKMRGKVTADHTDKLICTRLDSGGENRSSRVCNEVSKLGPGKGAQLLTKAIKRPVAPVK